jgi:hypothetical protein
VTMTSSIETGEKSPPLLIVTYMSSSSSILSLELSSTLRYRTVLELEKIDSIHCCTVDCLLEVVQFYFIFLTYILRIPAFATCKP